MAPIATSDSSTTTVDVGQRFGQLKLNVTPAPAAAPVVQNQKKESVRTVDPFNYVVSLSSSVLTKLMCRGKLTEMSLIMNSPISFVRPFSHSWT
jgi:hypothetical protein